MLNGLCLAGTHSQMGAIVHYRGAAFITFHVSSRFTCIAAHACAQRDGHLHGHRGRLVRRRASSACSFIAAEAVGGLGVRF